MKRRRTVVDRTISDIGTRYIYHRYQKEKKIHLRTKSNGVHMTRKIQKAQQNKQVKNVRKYQTNHTEGKMVKVVQQSSPTFSTHESLYSTIYGFRTFEISSIYIITRICQQVEALCIVSSTTTWDQIEHLDFFLQNLSYQTHCHEQTSASCIN